MSEIDTYCHSYSIRNYSYIYCDEHNPFSHLFLDSDTVGKVKNTKVFLRVYLNGIDQESDGFVLISIHLKDCHHNEEIKFHYRMWIQDYGQNKCNIKEAKAIVSRDKEFQIKRFIPRADIDDRRKGYLHEDKLIIYIKISLQKENLSSLIDFLETENSLMSESESDLKVQVFSESCRLNLKNICNYTGQSDMCLSSSDICLNEHAKFFLRFWPNGRNKQSENHLSIFLHHSTPTMLYDTQATVQYRLSLVDLKMQKCFSISNQAQITGGNEFGHDKFFKLADLIDKRNELLIDENELQIECVVYLIGDKIQNKPSNFKMNRQRLTQDNYAGLSDITKTPKTINNIFNVNSNVQFENVQMSYTNT